MFVAPVHFEVQVGRHAHRAGRLALLRGHRAQIEDVFVAAMRRVFPRFSLETAPIEWAFVIVLCEGLIENHRTSFFLYYDGSFLLAIKELLLNLIDLPHSILAGNMRAPSPPLSREDQVSGSLDLPEHVDLAWLLRLDRRDHLLSTVNVYVCIYILILSLIMLRGKGDGSVID